MILRGIGPVRGMENARKDYAGVAPALAGTSVAVIRGGQLWLGTVEHVGTDPVADLLTTRDAVLEAVAGCGTTIAVHGYGYASRAWAHQEGALQGVLLSSLHEAAHDVRLMPPSAVRMFVTGQAQPLPFLEVLFDRQQDLVHSENEAAAAACAIIAACWGEPERLPVSPFQAKAIRQVSE